MSGRPEQAVDPYDIFPYESVAFPQTHPANMAVLGRLFGLRTADPARCRVLELGCASGGNLIPLAWHLPNALFLGIDLSGHQIEEGRALVGQLKLDNIELRQGDILDLGAELGEFDYVIAHGVYSWVPQPVREHLLGLVPRLLAQEGLFFLSYNCLPGWRMRGMIRDILLHACRDAQTPAERLDAARDALQRLGSAVNGLEALSARYLSEEIAGLHDAHPSYLYFEYLAQHNRPFLFTEVAADLERHKLQYLCDTDLRTAFPSSYGEEMDKALADIEDGLELEQWLDFAINRNFRQSLICRADATLDDGIDLERFASLSFCADLKVPRKPDLKRTKAASFITNKGESLDVTHPLTKAVLVQLVARYPDCLPLPDLMPEAGRQVATAGGGELASQIDECLSELFSLFAHRAVLARPQPLSLDVRMDERPRASPLAIAQVRAGALRIATIHHGNLDLDSFAVRLLEYLDGSNTNDQLVDLLASDLAEGNLTPPKDVQPRKWSRQKLRQRTSAAVHNLLSIFSRYGVLQVSRDRG